MLEGGEHGESRSGFTKGAVDGNSLCCRYYQPYFPAGNQALYVSKELPIGASSPFAPGLFDLRGVSLAAWTLAAFAIGVFAGALIRRVVPAIVATLARLRDRRVPPPALLGAARHQQADRSRFRVGHRPAVVHQERPAGEQGRAQRGAAECTRTAVWERRGSEVRHRVAVPRPARVHAVAHLPAGQPVLDIPVDRGRWLLALSVLCIAVTVWMVRRPSRIDG